MSARWGRAGPGSNRSAGTGTLARSIPRSPPTDGSWATIVIRWVRDGLTDELTEFLLGRKRRQRVAGQEHVQVAGGQDVGMPQQPGGGVRPQLAQHGRQRTAFLGRRRARPPGA